MSGDENGEGLGKKADLDVASGVNEFSVHLDRGGLGAMDVEDLEAAGGDLGKLVDRAVEQAGGY